MNLMDDGRWFLSAMELKLCVRLLTEDSWGEFPMTGGEEPSQQEMLNAFLHLHSLGLLQTGKTGYIVTEQMKRRFLPVVQPQLTLFVQEGETALWLFERDDAVTAVHLQKNTYAVDAANLQEAAKRLQHCDANAVAWVQRAGGEKEEIRPEDIADVVFDKGGNV